MKIFVIVVIVVVVLFGMSSMYVVSEGQIVLLLQFGCIVCIGDQFGLYFKLLLVQQVMCFDSCILIMDVQLECYFIFEKKSVNVDFYVKWCIVDNVDFYCVIGGDLLQVVQCLSLIVKNVLCFEFNGCILQELIIGGCKDIIDKVCEQIDVVVCKNFGIQVVDVCIKCIDLFDEVSDLVYKCMKVECLQLVNELCYIGEQMVIIIIVDVDCQGQVLCVNVECDVVKICGEGDVQVVLIYVQVYGQDLEFFVFYCFMEVYCYVFGDGKSMFIVKLDDLFLQYFQFSVGKC